MLMKLTLTDVETEESEKKPSSEIVAVYLNAQRIAPSMYVKSSQVQLLLYSLTIL